MNLKIEPGMQQNELTNQVTDLSRRRFFQLAGGIAGAGIILSACRRTAPNTFFVGSGDVGLLNYLYILKQVQSNFYIQANATPYYDMDESELQLIADLRDHQLAHRALLKAILAGNAIPNITTTFPKVTFADRTSVLTNSAMFEDLSVAALNGAAQLFSDTDYITISAKMVTVDARHSAYVRDILNYSSFADSTVITSNGLDQASKPLTVMATLENYILTRFDTSKLPD